MSTYNIPLPMSKRMTQNYPKYNNVCSCGKLCKRLKNEFEIAVLNEPSVFEPLKVYFILNNCYRWCLLHLLFSDHLFYNETTISYP